MEKCEDIGAETSCGAGVFTSTDPFVHVVQSKATKVLLTKLREKNSDSRTFATYLDRACNILAEEGLASDHLVTKKKIETPCGECDGFFSPDYTELCAVSILRSGDLVLEAVRRLEPGIPVGKILIQRDESDPEKKPTLFYLKVPKDLGTYKILLVDPMLATGGSASLAVRCLIDNGAKEENITFLNLICCPEGVAAFRAAHPKIHIVTLAIDESMNHDKYIVPGIGDCGDRAFNTL